VSLIAAVNLPGTYYAVDASGQAAAVLCPPHQYGPGLRKQRACVDCPVPITDLRPGKMLPSSCGEEPVLQHVLHTCMQQCHEHAWQAACCIPGESLWLHVRTTTPYSSWQVAHGRIATLSPIKSSGVLLRVAAACSDDHAAWIGGQAG